MDGFKSLNELYTRLKPALRSKCKDLKRIGIDYIQEVDIWNYLRINNWTKRTNLTLADMVNDIMCADNTELIKYVQDIIKKEKREIIDEY